MVNEPTQKYVDDAFTDAPWSILSRRLFAECCGAFALVAVDCGGAVIAEMSHEVSPAARSIATGLLVMSAIYVLGDVSGAHFNPAVTVAFALRRVFPWRHVPAYWAAQCLGALLGASFLAFVFGSTGGLGTTVPKFGSGPAFIIEVLLTTLLVAVSLGTATRHRVLGPNAAIAGGGTVALCSLFSRPISGASMNPARSLAPALVSRSFSSLWIYLTAPMLGAAIAVVLMALLHPRKHSEEPKAAGGEKKS